MRIDIQNNGLVNYTTFSTSYLVGQRDNVSLDLIREVVKLLAWDFFENTPWLSCFVLQMVKTELKWSSGNHTLNFK